jgi:hypothetical protein
MPRHQERECDMMPEVYWRRRLTWWTAPAMVGAKLCALEPVPARVGPAEQPKIDTRNGCCCQGFFAIFRFQDSKGYTQNV